MGAQRLLQCGGSRRERGRVSRLDSRAQLAQQGQDQAPLPIQLPSNHTRNHVSGYTCKGRTAASLARRVHQVTAIALTDEGANEDRMTYIRFAAVGLFVAATAIGCSKKEPKPTAAPASNPPIAGQTAAPEGGTGTGVRQDVEAESDKAQPFQGVGDEDEGDDEMDEDTYSKNPDGGTEQRPTRPPPQTLRRIAQLLRRRRVREPNERAAAQLPVRVPRNRG